MSQPELVFVYNADSGLFNAMADTAHKIFAPKTYNCNLCKVTYGWFTESEHWRAFLSGLDARCTFLHRDEFKAGYPDINVALPAVLHRTGGHLGVCIDAEALNGCQGIDDLIQLVRARCLG